MDIISLTVAPRTAEHDTRVLRRESKVPCNVYGNDMKATSLSADHNEIYKVYSQAGESTLVELTIDGKKVPVLFHELQFDPVSDRITHVDFYAVNMKKEIDANIPVHIVGKSPAIADLGGILVMGHDHVKVMCLPANLPHALEVDISSIVEFDQHVSVKDIKVPTGVRIVDDADVVICSVQEPRKEEVQEAPVAAAEGAAPADGAAPAAEGEKKEGAAE